MDGIDNKYIDNAIESLLTTIGIRDYIDSKALESLIRARKVKEAIKEIAKYLGLPVEVNLTYIPEGYRPNSNGVFTSKDLVKTDSQGKGTAGISAQVNIPSNLPLYGSNGMVGFPINVLVSENYVDYPLTFIGILAHELSHIVLHSLWHKEKENEYYTDVTAMLLGFGKLMQNGRKIIKSYTTENIVSKTTRTETTTYGYLSDDNFSFALEKIEKILKTAKSQKSQYIFDIKLFQDNVANLYNEISNFKKYLNYVDKHIKKKISPADGHWISSFHRPDYTEEFEITAKKFRDELNRFEYYTDSINHYNDYIFEQIKQQKDKLYKINNDVFQKYERVHGAVRILIKYVPIWEKIKYYMKIK
ncbi:hypothetical protein ACFLYQ_00845 [Chloroflexota bacterium]